jgi:hypothetical protein
MEINLKKHLDEYYDSLIGYKHSASRLDKVLQNDIEKYNGEESSLFLASLQIVKDWSGLTDNGWAYTYPTDSFIQIEKENYCKYIKGVLSNQFCHLYVQSFEGLERLLKNLLFELKDDIEIAELIRSKLKQNQKDERLKIPTGDNLFDIIKSIIIDFEFRKGELNFDWKTSIFVLSKTRNGIVHKNSNFAKSLIFCSTDKKNLVKDLFQYEEINSSTVKLSLDLIGFKNLIDFMCDFAFQIFKKICISQEIDWKIYKNMNKH